MALEGWQWRARTSSGFGVGCQAPLQVSLRPAAIVATTRADTTQHGYAEDRRLGTTLRITSIWFYTVCSTRNGHRALAL